MNQTSTTGNRYELYHLSPVIGTEVRAIDGMAPGESRELLDYLFGRASIPGIQCRFRWTVDAIAFWGNRSTQHYAAADYCPEQRRM